MTERAVITGAAVITSLGSDLDATWRSLCTGASGVRALSAFDASAFPCANAGQVNLPSVSDAGLSVRDESLMGRHGAMLLHTSRRALADAAIAEESAQLAHMAFFTNMARVDPAEGDLEAAIADARTPAGIELDRFFTSGYRKIHPLWPLSMLNNIAFCIVSTALGVRGENAVFSAGADGGVAALSEAAAAVLEGRAGLALVAGVSASLTPMSLARAHLEEADTAISEPLPPGEGCGVLVLETETSARRRGVRAHAVAASWSSRCGRDDETRDEVMQQAMTGAGLAASEIDLVLLHAGPTEQAKRDEETAIRRVFGDFDGAVADSKTALGHLGAAAGAVDLCLAARALEARTLPQALVASAVARGKTGGDFPDPRAVLINANGASGQRAAVVLTRAVG